MKKIVSFALVMMVALSACKSREESKIGTQKVPLKVGFMPSASKEVMEQGAKVITDELGKNAGISVEPFIAKDYISLVDGLASKKIDVAFINPLGFLLAHDWCKAEAIFQLINESGKMYYRSGVITRNDTGIKTLADINGKTFAYSDPFSMAGYLMPLDAFKENSVTPSNTTFAGSYYSVVEMVYNGLINAGAIYFSERDPDGRIHDARLKLVGKYNDMIDKVPVIFTSDAIPTPPVAVRAGLEQGLKEKVKRSFQLAALNPSVVSALSSMYDAKGLAPADDKAFDNIRGVLKKLGKDVQEVVPGAVEFYKKHLWDVVPSL